MKNLLLLLSTLFFLFSCSSGGSNYKCLISYEGDYERILSKKELLSVYSKINTDEMKISLSNNKITGNHVVQWPSETIGKETNKIELTSYDVYDDKWDLATIAKGFDVGYEDQKNLTEEKENPQFTLEKIEGLGTSTWFRWYTNENWGSLEVLAGRTKFTVRVALDETKDEHLEVAKKVASIILSKC